MKCPLIFTILFTLISSIHAILPEHQACTSRSLSTLEETTTDTDVQDPNQQRKAELISKTVAELKLEMVKTSRRPIGNPGYDVKFEPDPTVPQSSQACATTLYWGREAFLQALLLVISELPGFGEQDEGRRPTSLYRGLAGRLQSALQPHPDHNPIILGIAAEYVRTNVSNYRKKTGTYLSMVWSLVNEFRTWIKQLQTFLNRIHFRITHRPTVHMLGEFRKVFSEISKNLQKQQKHTYKAIINLGTTLFEAREMLERVKGAMHDANNFYKSRVSLILPIFKIYLESESYDSTFLDRVLRVWLLLFDKIDTIAQKVAASIADEPLDL
ncbi:hypothetical protein O5D80_006229 [Batrachochytrium dendrobatidis]|nr:hypothetical protein O5D80_006229 [Batrachochytrium dendrobatidis]